MTLAMPGPKIGGFSSSERRRIPSTVDKFAATLATVMDGTAGPISPAAYKLGYDYNLSKAMDGSERRRIPSTVDKFAATLATVMDGTAGPISPAAYKLGYDYNLNEVMDGVYDNALRYRKRNPLEFLDGFIAQITPGIVSNIMTGGQQGLLPGILTKDVKTNRLIDYFDALDHDTDTLREIFGPLQAP